ncbi:MAG: DUF6930 domain-containing protein [Thermodesulfovibrionales bacterium]
MNQEPSLEEWKKLYKTTLSLRGLEPWTYMEETDIFGVCDPESGIIGFCCIIGSWKEALGLIVYRGKAGLESYRKLRRGVSYNEMIDIQDCISILFVNNYELAQEDIEVMKSIVIDTKSPNIYPQFRDHIPFYIPWFLTQKEVSFLNSLLGEVINMCLRFKDKKTILKSPKKGQILVRMPVKNTDGIAWEDSWIFPEDIQSEKDSVFIIDEIALRRIKKKCKTADIILEIDSFYTTDLIVNDPDKNRPCIPLHLLIVDKESRFIFGNALSIPSRFYQDSFNSLTKSFETYSFIPREIHIKNPELLTILEPIKSYLAIPVRIVKDLKSFNFAKRALLKFLKKESKAPF